MRPTLEQFAQSFTDKPVTGLIVETTTTLVDTGWPKTNIPCTFRGVRCAHCDRVTWIGKQPDEPLVARYFLTAVKRARQEAHDE